MPILNSDAFANIDTDATPRGLWGRVRDNLPVERPSFELCRLEQLESRVLLNADLPSMHLVSDDASQFDDQVIYLDFDGAADVTYNGPVVVNGIDVPVFKAPAAFAGQEPAIIASVLDGLSRTFADTGLAFTTQQPEPGTDYSTVYMGGEGAAFAEYGSFFGLAEQVDAGNRSATDDAFVFSERFDQLDLNRHAYADELMRVAAHEIGHLVGFEHDQRQEDGGLLLDVAANGIATIELVTPPSCVNKNQQYDIKVRIMLTENTKPGPWVVNEISLRDDLPSILYRTIVKDTNPGSITQQNKWYDYTFFNIVLSNWADGGDGVELYAHVEIDDNTPFNGDVKDDSPIHQVGITPGIPGPPDLDASDDKGRYNNDDITYDHGNPFTFSWQSASDVDRYFYAWDKIPDSGDSSTTGTTVHVSPPSSHGEHEFFIRSWNAQCGFAISSRFLPVFIDRNRPSVSDIDLRSSDDSGYKNDDNITNDTSVRFDWNGRNNGGSGIWKYSWGWNRSGSQSGSTTNSYVSGINPPSSNDKVEFKVAAQAVSGLSGSFSFSPEITWDTSAPNAGAVSSPTGIITTLTPDIKWNYNSGTDWKFVVDLEEQTGSGSWGNVESWPKVAVRTNMIKADHLDWSTNYRVRLQEYDIAGNASWSEYRTFETIPTAPTAEITGFEYPTGTIFRGTKITTIVTVYNNASTPQEYWVGLSFAEPTATLGNWPIDWYDIKPLPVQLAIGATKEVRFDVVIPEHLDPGQYYAIAATWENYNTTTYLMEGNLDYTTNYAQWRDKDTGVKSFVLGAFNSNDTIEFDEQLEWIVEYMLGVDRSTLENLYNSGAESRKALLALRVDAGITFPNGVGVNAGGSLLFDLTDLFQITPEGEAGRITTWIDVDGSLTFAHTGGAPASFEFDFGVVYHDFNFYERAVADDRKELAASAGIVLPGFTFTAVSWTSKDKFKGPRLNWNGTMELGLEITASASGLVQHELNIKEFIDAFANADGANVASYVSEVVSNLKSSEIWSAATLDDGSWPLYDGQRISRLGLPEDYSPNAGVGHYFVIDVLVGTDAMTVSTSGGTGNADLYVRYDDRPTASQFHSRDFGSGNNETLTIENPLAGNWYIWIPSGGAQGYSNVDVIAVFDNAPEIDVRYNGVAILDGDDTPDFADGTYFGSVLLDGGTIDHVFTVFNTGNKTLNLTGGELVEITGEHASDFTMITQPDNSIAPGASTTFKIRFNPSALGTRDAQIAIANDDANENPYNFTIQGTGTEEISPEIDVRYNGVMILDGDDTPDSADGTYFGSVLLDGGTIDHVFTVFNTGNKTLNLTGGELVKITGEHAGDFTMITQPDNSIVPGSSTTFKIRFNPSTLGTRDAQIIIANDDANENPYNFTIRGTGTEDLLPEIEVTSNGRVIYDGDTTPSLSDGTDFGSTLLDQGTITHVFTIRNIGSQVLNLTGSQLIQITGAHAADFTVIRQPSASIAPNASTTFEIKFNPSVLWRQDAQIVIANNDADESPYNFAIRGEGINSNYYLYYPDGYRNDSSINEYVLITNPNNFAVTFDLIVHYETGGDEVGETMVSQRVVPAHARRGITLATFSDPGFKFEVSRANTPYAIEIRSNGPLGAAISHYDFGTAIGESFTSETSAQWVFPEVRKGDGVFDFLVFYNPSDTSTMITATFYPETGGPVVFTFSIGEFRRGGINMSNDTRVPDGTYGVVIESDSAQIVAALSHYEVPKGENHESQSGQGYGMLGSSNLPASGKMAGVFPMFDPASDAGRLVFLNPGQSNVNVTITISYENSSLSDIDIQESIGARSRLEIDLQNHGILSLASIYYWSDQPLVGFISETRNGEYDDALGYTAATTSSTDWLFADAFLGENDLGTNYFETLSLYNPGTSFATVDIDFIFTDGSVISFAKTVANGCTKTLSLHNEQDLIDKLNSGSSNQYEFFSIRLRSNIPIVAQMTHWDLTQQGGFATLGTPLGALVPIPLLS